MHTIRTLLPWESPKLRDHLLRLAPEDRRMRFGHAVGAGGIDTFVARIDWVRDRIFVAVDGGGEIIGVVHVSRLDGGDAELAFTVDAAWRGRGIGGALAERAMLWARNRGFRRIHIYCLAENMTMRRLAVRCAMRTRCEAADCEGTAELAPATPVTWLREMIGEGFGLSAALIAAQGRAMRLLHPAVSAAAA